LLHGVESTRLEYVPLIVVPTGNAVVVAAEVPTGNSTVEALTGNLLGFCSYGHTNIILTCVNWELI
jgi:hypothetical protein